MRKDWLMSKVEHREANDRLWRRRYNRLLYRILTKNPRMLTSEARRIAGALMAKRSK